MNKARKLRKIHLLITVIVILLGSIVVNRSVKNIKADMTCELYNTEDGQKFNLASLKGNRFVLEIFAPWCGYCLKVHSVINALHARGVPVYAIAWRTNAEELEAFFKKNGRPYDKVLFDHNGKCLDKMHMQGVPHILVIDRDGKTLYSGDSRTSVEGIMNFFPSAVKKDDGANSH